MLFNSLNFLIFFPLVCLGYYIIPHCVRYLFLLACSYYFYMCWNPKYALLMLASTMITYLSGLLLDLAKDKKRSVKNWIVALSFTSNLAILFFFKYYGFAVGTISRLLSLAHIQIAIPAFDVVLPVGISFYTFQALSYTMDVYRGEIYAEKNFFKYALFVSFFPQLVAGPIERSKNLLIQISERHRFDFDRVRSGLILMGYGFFQKIVLSEYLGHVVDAIYVSPESVDITLADRTGMQLLIASILFAFQIYCDFGSYSNIAIGAARVMGFRLMENFNTPYFSRSVAEFWRRWHISLSTWFRDYLYIPLGGNRKGRIRKYFNLMVVFLVSGLWHGASWHYVVWGGLNGLFQVIGDILKPLKKAYRRLFHVDESSASHKVFQMIVTFILVDFTWIFFRAESFMRALEIIRKILGISEGAWFSWGNNLSTMGLTLGMRNVLVVSLLLLLVVDLFKYFKVNLIDWILKQRFWMRWSIYLAVIFGILIYGIYGPGYDASAFIYFQF